MDNDSAKKKRKRRRNWGTVRQTGRSTFRAEYTGPNKKRYAATTPDGQPLSFPTRSTADAWLNKCRAQIAAGKWRDPATLRAELFGAYAQAWILQRRNSAGEPLAERTATEYRRYIAVGLKSLEHVPLRDLTPARVRALHAERAEYGATQAAREMRFLNAVLNTALDDELIERNPVPNNLRNSKTGVPHRKPDADELAAMLEAMPAKWRAAVLIAAFGGLRISEWRALRRQDIELVGNGDDAHYQVAVTRQAQYIAGKGWVVGETKSKAGIRTIDLPTFLTPAIETHLDEYTGVFPDSLLFAPTGGAEFVSDSVFRRQAWDKARDALGVRGQIRGHDLRHFFGSALAAVGASLPEIQNMLGHSTATATLGYLHENERRAELANKLPPLPTPKQSNVTDIQQQRRKAK